jgi:hypothetical protein
MALPFINNMPRKSERRVKNVVEPLNRRITHLLKPLKKGTYHGYSWQQW